MGKVISVSIESHIDEYTEEMEEKVQAWLAAVGEDAAGVAADVAPVDTGRLRNSLTAATQDYQTKPNTYSGAKAKPKDYRKKSKPEKKTVYIGTNVEYAEYNEFGSIHNKARHFIQFGMTAHKERYEEMLEQKLKE